ncbi:MAG TPA: diacylglycerol kinase family protein [Bacteroidales bacterium]|nr:diacylglycerol kinase family protein [Bacteroidales bacterium]
MKGIISVLIQRLRSIGNAVRGLGNLLENEPNVRIHIIAAVSAIILGIITGITTVEWLIIVVVAGMVFVSEIFNSAVERLADIVDPHQNEKIRIIKDYAAAAVLVSAIIALTAGLIIFIPGIINLFR